MKLRPVTRRVYPDEGCWGMIECPMIIPQPDGSHPWRWVQQLKVVRNDRIAYYVTDFGPAEDFEDVTPILMPSFGENTVAHLQEYGEKNRKDNHWAKRRNEMLEGSTLVKDAITNLEMEWELVHNRSHLGPRLSVQRNNAPRAAIREATKARIYDSRRKG